LPDLGLVGAGILVLVELVDIRGLGIDQLVPPTTGPHTINGDEESGY